jgi:primosomal replication protein N''
MMRFCPNCLTERSLSEMVCEGSIEEHACNWNLAGLPIRPAGWRPLPPAVTPSEAGPAAICLNGHAVEPGDLLCPACGADLAAGDTTDLPRETGPTVIAGWRLDRRLASTSQVRERYVTSREADGHQALLTLYSEGHEPDAEVYDVLRVLSHDHVPDILDTGRWQDRAFEVTEDLQGGTLADLGLLPDDLATLSRVLEEVGGALNALAECGLRHRDLRPGAILVRTREPLDLVITSFGSARLSDADLDIVSPLEITRYTAPEAVAGGVAAASDWWSLGMLLLEQVTRGACFEGVNDQAFLIYVLTNGAAIPEGLEPSVDLLLRGLLARDRRERWGWPQVQRWLAGDRPAAPASARSIAETTTRHTISLGGKPYSIPTAFALAAAENARWEEARSLLVRGDLATWAEDAELDLRLQAEVRQIAHLEGVSEDLRLSLALKALNPAMPLAYRGEIITPGWLLDNPEEGYDLIVGPVPDLLKRKDAEPWLSRLKIRAAHVRERARQLDIALNSEELKVNLLSTSRSRLAAVWEVRRNLLPDTDHPGLIALMERRQTTDEDYILLLSADVSQFRTVDVIVAEASETAARAGIESFDPLAAIAWLKLPRREIYGAIEKRLVGFSRCGRERIDEWADRFRLERRLPIARALTLLALPEVAWCEPPKQTYVATLLDFFSKRITGAIMRGPLTRMVIGKTTARLDLTELDSERRPAGALLDHLLLRNDQTVDLDQAVLLGDQRIERRVRTLYSHATLYRRDTGIDGLYLGFPFLLMQEAKASTRPRIAPVLLWPVRLRPEVGARGRIVVGFDRDREEVRLNPAFEALLGADPARRWEEAGREMLGRASVSTAEVMDAFAELANVQSRSLVALPSKDAKVPVGDDHLVCAGALFHLAYLGQAVMEDLRQLKAIPPSGTSLETALRVTDCVPRVALERVRELDRYFTAASDPSQETAVMEARNGAGLLIEGPPGTGKSQTIVNMVGDAIGRQKSLLIVCQKQAALEVVHKRLEAEGLGDRIMMINDVNKDRQRAIRAVREQLDALWALPAGGVPWRQQREQVAARIEALEAELDRHQVALHVVDRATGSSYRQVLGDLIAFQAGARPLIEVPGLRVVLGSLDVGEVAALQEVCGPLARLWLPAAYEDSPLSVIKAFSADAGTLALFASDLEAFVGCEQARCEVVERTPDAIQIEDPALYRSWSERNASVFLGLDDVERERLARWLPLLVPASGAARLREILSDLDEITAGLEALPSKSPRSHAVEVALGLSASDLVAWTDLADMLSAPPSLLGRLSLARWKKARRMRLYLRSQSLEFLAFRDSLYNEQALRPWRDRLAVLRRILAEQPAELDSHSPLELADIARALRIQITDAEELVGRLGEHPRPGATLAMASAASRSAVEALFEHMSQGYARHEARCLSLAALAHLERWFENGWLEARRLAIAEDLSSGQALASIYRAPNLVAYQRFRARASQLDASAIAAFRALRLAGAWLGGIPEVELDGEVRRILGRESRLAWKSRLEGDHPVLLLEASELKAKGEALAQADGEIRRLNRRLLVDGVDVTRLRPAREWEDITRLTGQRARRLREFLDRGADLGLMSLRPVWLMNPDVASRVLPLKCGLFDAVIFDEASQIPVEYALPSLFRSRTMIVSGDEKQMPPTAFFTSKVENDEAEPFEGDEAEDGLSEGEREELTETWNRKEIKDCPDLLQLAKTVLPTAPLKIHYRSAYRELIQFSNASFYGNRLSIPARHPEAEIRRVKPIEVVRADGIYEDQTNETEAQRVADVMAQLWNVPAPLRKSVGVVTFNRRQADLIEEVLEARAEHDAAFREALSQERDRIEYGEDMGFFVKNVENVQGDERDIIVFSSTFGRNAQGTFRRSFGVLGQAGGERRLNVAVTRAREKVILVTSMPVTLISDLLTTRRQAETPRDFLQAYFEYARAISAGELETGRALLSRLVPGQREDRSHPSEDQDGFQLAVAAEIERLGWRPHPLNGAGAFGLDFAIEDRRTGLYGIGIECDAPRHALLEKARAREMWRPDILRRSIPVVHRVSSHGWYHAPTQEKARLRDAIQEALQGVPA